MWAVTVISLITFFKTLLDALNKSAEAEAAHAKHYNKEVTEPAIGGTWSPKEKVDFASFVLGFLASFLGIIFAALKAGDFVAAMIIWGLGFIAALFGVAWAGWYYTQTNESKVATWMSKPVAWISSKFFRKYEGLKT